MKFNCGLNAHKRWLERKSRIEIWHPYFAWLPIQVGDYDCRWFEWIERRAICYQTIEGVREWEFRAAQGKTEGNK